MAQGWKCPDCRVVLAPHVSEHRCDPPGGVVSITRIDPPGTGGVSATSVPPGWTVTVAGPVTSERDLLDAMQDRMLTRSANNWRGTVGLPPGRVA